MRASVDGLGTATSLAHALPAVYQEDDFTMRFVGAFDAVLAPVLLSLDTIDAYLDPRLAPPDFLPWLAGWLGLEIDENWDDEQARRMIGSAVELFRWQGTRRGVQALVLAWTGLLPDALEVVDTGGATWSPVPQSEPPGDPTPELVVRLRIAPQDAPDLPRLRRFLATTAPAEVPVRVELLPV